MLFRKSLVKHKAEQEEEEEENKSKNSKMKPYKLIRANASIQLKEYLSNSSVAVQQFLVQGAEHQLVSCTWRLLLYSAIVIALMIIMNLWDTFRRNPRFTVLDMNTHGIPLTFPSVFLCPEEVMDTELLSSFVHKTISDNNLNITHKEFQECFESLSSIDYAGSEVLTRCRHHDTFLRIPGLESQFLNTLYTVESAFRNCSWKGISIPCSTYIKSFHTERGYCYVFNNFHVDTAYKSLDPTKIDVVKGALLYEYDTDWSFAFSMRHLKGLTLIYLMGTHDMLTFDDRAIIKWDQLTETALKFKITDNYCTDSVRVLSVSQRGCLFNDEPYDFPVAIKGDYNQNVCWNFCHAQLFYEHCNCIARNYKQLFLNIPYPTCNLTQLLCIATHRKTVEEDACKNCLKNCNFFQYSLQYEAQESDRFLFDDLTQTDPSGNQSEPETSLANGDIAFEPISLELLDWPMFRYKTSIIFGLLELIVSLGGVAGLILGCSFMTCVEILYYASLRFFCALRMSKPEIVEKVYEQEQEDGVIPPIRTKLRPC